MTKGKIKVFISYLTVIMIIAIEIRITIIMTVIITVQVGNNDESKKNEPF